MGYTPKLLCLLLACLLIRLTACTKAPEDIAGQVQAADQQVNAIGADRLGEDAAALLAREAVVDGGFPPATWPGSFETFKPVRVAPLMLGVLIVTDSSEQYERGVYIVVDPIGLPPDEGSGFASTPLDDRIFFIEQKVRRAARAAQADREE